MIRIKENSALYGNFQDILTGYRLTLVLMQMHESGVAEFIGVAGGVHGDEICAHAGWKREAGLRFLDVLCGVGLLGKNEEGFFLTEFSKKFLVSGSESYQGETLEFEKKLIDSWGLLGETLKSGRREYGVDKKTPDEYKQAVDTYIGAMDNAARVRSSELWERIGLEDRKKGRLLDIGAGSGAYTKAFLKRYPAWSGIFCDLADIVEKAKENPELAFCRDRITFRSCNLLEPDSGLGDNGIKADVALLSNIIHCYGEGEISVFIENALENLSDDGIVIVHDFFRDQGWRGALYDVHMMLNTFNGRTYATGEIKAMMEKNGFRHSLTVELPSGSCFIAAARQKKSLDTNVV